MLNGITVLLFKILIVNSTMTTNNSFNISKHVNEMKILFKKQRQTSIKHMSACTYVTSSRDSKNLKSPTIYMNARPWRGIFKIQRYFGQLAQLIHSSELIPVHNYIE